MRETWRIREVVGVAQGDAELLDLLLQLGELPFEAFETIFRFGILRGMVLRPRRLRLNRPPLPRRGAARSAPPSGRGGGRGGRRGPSRSSARATRAPRRDRGSRGGGRRAASARPASAGRAA